jgi:hypothetical protein
VTAGASTQPLSSLVGGLHGMGATPQVANLLRHRPPLRAVCSSRPSEGVRNFMQQHLGDLGPAGFLGEVSGDRDGLCSVVALAETSGGAIKAERPGSSDLVGSQKPHRLLLYPDCICHVDRLAGARDGGESYPQGESTTQSRQIVINAYTLKVCFPDFLCRHIAVDTRAPSIAAG